MFDTPYSRLEIDIIYTIYFTMLNFGYIHEGKQRNPKILKVRKI